MASDYAQLAIEETARYEGVVPIAPYRVSTNVLYLPQRAIAIRPGPTFDDRSDEARNIEGGVAQQVIGFEPEGSLSMRAYVNSLVFLLQIAGWTGTHTSGATGGTDEIQQVTTTGVPTGGFLRLVFNPPDGSPSESTADIAFNASAATVQAALNSLRNMQGANVVCSGGPLPTAVIITFSGGKWAKRDIPALTFTHTLTGGASPTPVIATNTPGAGGSVTDPEGRNVPTGVDKWVFTKRGGLTAKTAQLILAYGDEGVFLRGQGFGVSSLALTANGDLTADLVGLVLQRIADPSLSPSLDASTILSLLRGDLFLKWLSTGGAVSDFNVQLTNPLVRQDTLNLSPPSKYPDQAFHGDDRVRITGSVPKYALDPDDVDTLMAGTTFAATARWQNQTLIGGTTYPYSLWMEMPKAQYIGFAPDDLANRRRFGANFDFWAAWDEGLGYDCRITLIGNVPAVETYV